MRTPRSDGEAISDAARIRRAALLSADMLTAARWDGTAPLLADGSTLSRRLHRRLFTEIAEAHGDPATFADGARRLISMDADGLAKAAFRAGFAYHLAAFCPAVDRPTLARLRAAYGEEAVAFALGHINLSTATPPLDLLSEQARHVVEADGWSMLTLLADEYRISAAWRWAGWRDMAENGSASLLKSPALVLATAAVDEVASTQEGAGR
ncbi:hypothetical protein AMC82_PC00099 (plasmid) [Rhizobium phaseoli]|jgi:hypothetical protein|uniref:Uncharacterized protein n=4 Tax=Rhizobium TaxID=379 RepID=A0A7W4MWK8_9HYPH|nr:MULTISPECIES: hypothetical protein [Rhizobium]UWU38867.1 hypothetical protein N2597_31160 [Rhizobium leguminosarum bv. phaseoli]ANL68663.1 hypothetical protein AMC84_PC00099 [Rhizobium phaseoli]ANL81472.1 hypothetical protein AMC82_PC00099 [Rhizobium phaseoli]ANL87960.1 hypothetical protein AMC81_PD00103 [Rhizobium phaseoli]ANL94469.1 hypothetical protein AMC80_PD00103 [Rhizobium phaseoli]